MQERVNDLSTWTDIGAIGLVVVGVGAGRKFGLQATVHTRLTH